eukprot:TRINITY_DN16800_c0_g1_i1.p1 TRINITY_DN16800_c0_g1~~TRINITY_DN16800_c0_g1_i1.p1  ORF type:complete len:689 (+),score=156.26 TRINITY_DN16800_c0_g1_i1:92-2068(+)
MAAPPQQPPRQPVATQQPPRQPAAAAGRAPIRSFTPQPAVRGPQYVPQSRVSAGRAVGLGATTSALPQASEVAQSERERAAPTGVPPLVRRNSAHHRAPVAPGGAERRNSRTQTAPTPPQGSPSSPTHPPGRSATSQQALQSPLHVRAPATLMSPRVTIRAQTPTVHSEEYAQLTRQRHYPSAQALKQSPGVQRERVPAGLDYGTDQDQAPLAVADLRRLWSVPYEDWAVGTAGRAVASAQAFIRGFEYSIAGASHAPRKQRPLYDILAQCVPIIASRDQHAIQCIEAALVGVYLTQGLPSSQLIRFGISFESQPDDLQKGLEVDAAGRSVYYHIVLGVAVMDESSRRRRFGAIGISRSPVLASRPCVFPSLYELLRSYELGYKDSGHTLVSCKLGRPMPQGPCRYSAERREAFLVAKSADGEGIAFHNAPETACACVVQDGERLALCPEPEQLKGEGGRKWAKVEWGERVGWVRRRDTAVAADPAVDSPISEAPYAAGGPEVAAAVSAASARFRCLDYCDQTPVWYGEHINLRSPDWRNQVNAFQRRIANPRTFWGFNKGCDPYRGQPDDPDDRARRPRGERQKALHRRRKTRLAGTAMPPISGLGVAPACGDETVLDEFTWQLRQLPLEHGYGCWGRFWAICRDCCGVSLPCTPDR